MIRQGDGAQANYRRSETLPARQELASVTSPRYTWKKYKLQMISYIPKSGISFIRNHAITLSYLKRKIIRK